jgi:formylglycine-generating enzyme required for sulfatase activity
VRLSGAAESFGLPDCAREFAGEVVLNAPILEAMIAQAAPGGSQPNRQHEQLLISSKYYLERQGGLVVLARTAMDQPPVVLQQDCLPYPAAVQVPTFFAELTLEQKQVLTTYHDLIRPQANPVAQPAGKQVTTANDTMARVPAGAFNLGTGQMATLAAFTIDVYEVTNAQYKHFLETGGYDTKTYWSDDGWRWVQEKHRRQPGYWDDELLNKPDQPVVGVSWYEADAYCRWAGKVLPTQQQWEKACRSTDGRRFPWGNAPLAAPEQGPSADPSTYTAPAAVGSRPQAQSPYGVHDLAGNVEEWTATARDGQGMLLLGGSGDNVLERVGCGVEHILLPSITANFIGFRCLSNLP